MTSSWPVVVEMKQDTVGVKFRRLDPVQWIRRRRKK